MSHNQNPDNWRAARDSGRLFSFFYMVLDSHFLYRSLLTMTRLIDSSELLRRHFGAGPRPALALFLPARRGSDEVGARSDQDSGHQEA